MIIVCLTVFSLILSQFQHVSYMIILCLIFSSILSISEESELHKVHDYCLFVYFLFYLVTISASELHKVHDYCLFDCFLFNLVTMSVGE